MFESLKAMPDPYARIFLLSHIAPSLVTFQVFRGLQAAPCSKHPLISHPGALSQALQKTLIG